MRKWEMKREIGRGEKRNIHRKIWESMCLPKSAGDLGFRDRAKFNEAMSVASRSR